MRLPYLRKSDSHTPPFLLLIIIFLFFSIFQVKAQRAIRIEPDFFNGEIIISDTLVPADIPLSLHATLSEALATLFDPVPLDSFPDIKTWLYRAGNMNNKYPVLVVSKKEHWMVIPLKDFTGYGLPTIHRIKLRRQYLVLVQATIRDRYFTSEDNPSGFQAEKGMVEVIDVVTGRRHLLQEANIHVEQGRWSKGPEGNVASSYDQELELGFNNRKMQIKVSAVKTQYTTASGRLEKSQQVSLEYDFHTGLWIRKKAVMVNF